MFSRLFSTTSSPRNAGQGLTFWAVLVTGINIYRESSAVIAAGHEINESIKRVRAGSGLPLQEMPLLLGAAEKCATSILTLVCLLQTVSTVPPARGRS